MPILADFPPATASSVDEISSSTPRVRSPAAILEGTIRNREHLLSTILTTSVCLHLLIVGYLGFGPPAEIVRPRIARASPPPPPVIENIQLEAPPPPKAPREIRLQDQPPPVEQDLPAPAAAIAAVPANLAVAFAVKVEGPVRLVSDLAEAGGGGPVLPALPREVVGRNLLTDQLSYPPEALYRHLTGRVVVEFHTTPTGDIVDVRVRASSGSAVLDRAALENLRVGRWVGEAGYFTKTYDFVLR
jgi:protein TonB